MYDIDTYIDRSGAGLLRRLSRWGIRLVVAIVVLAVIGWFAWNEIAKRSLRNEIARIRAAGEPLTFAELAGSTTPPREDDATGDYEAAMALLSQEDQQAAGWLYEIAGERETGPLRWHGVVQAQWLLDKNRLALELLDRAATREQCHVDLNVSTDLTPFLSRLGPTRGLSKLVCFRTRLLALQGRGDEAVDSLISGLRMARIFERQPVLMTTLVQVAGLAICTRDLPVVLDSGQPSDAALLRLAAELERAESTIDLKRTWQGERAFSLATMLSHLPEGPELLAGVTRAASRDPLLPPGFGNPLAGPFARTWLVQVLRFHKNTIAAAERAWPASLDATSYTPSAGLEAYYSPMLNTLRPTYDKAIKQVAGVIAQLRTSRVAVLAELHRRGMGEWPNSVAELASGGKRALPLDPFTGKELLCRQTSAGFVVYSVAQDKQDQGGTRWNGTTGDLVTLVPGR